MKLCSKTGQEEWESFYPILTLPLSVQLHFQSGDYPDSWVTSLGLPLLDCGN